MKRIRILFTVAALLCVSLAQAMSASDIPERLPIPFANSAGGSYIRTVPTPSQIPITPGAASLTDGFPPLNFTEISAGGIPPDGRDMNGILNVATAWNRWQAAGGPVTWDSTFAASVGGGYPKGALVRQSTTSTSYWFSLVENNTTNPASDDGTHWVAVGYGTTYAGNPNGNVAGVGVNAKGITASMLWDTTNSVMWICTATGDAAGAVWTAVTGTVTAVSVASANGFAGSSSGGATPVLTMSTSITGMIKGNGTAISAASAGSDYVAPSQFTGANQDLSNPGYQKLPGGFIIQWGLTSAVPSGSTGLVVTFPIAFPTKALSITAQFTNSLTPSTGKDMASNVTDPADSTTQFTITQQSGAASQYSWIAIGH